MQLFQKGRVTRAAHEGDAGAQHRFAQVPARGHPQPLVVQKAALALFRPEHLVGDRIVGHPGDDLAGALQRHGDGEVGDGVQKVGGAVQRVGDPGVGLVGALDHPALFTQEAVAGPRRGQGVEQHLLGLGVGGGDIVGGTLLGDLQLAQLAEVAGQPARGLARGVDHHLDEGCGGGHAPVSRRGAYIRRFRWRPAPARRFPYRAGSGCACRWRPWPA